MKSAAAALDSCKRNGKLLLTNWRDQVKWQVYCDSNYRSAIFFQNGQINYANLKYSLPRHQSQSQPVSHQSSQMLWPSSPFPPLYSSAVNYVVVHLYRRKLWAFIAFRIVFLSLPVTGRVLLGKRVWEITISIPDNRQSQLPGRTTLFALRVCMEDHSNAIDCIIITTAIIIIIRIAFLYIPIQPSPYSTNETSDKQRAEGPRTARTWKHRVGRPLCVVGWPGDECKWWHFKGTHNATFINTLHLSAGKSRLSPSISLPLPLSLGGWSVGCWQEGRPPTQQRALQVPRMIPYYLVP